MRTRLQQIPCNWKFSWAIKVQSALSEWGNSNLSRELSVICNFVIIFDISTDVYNISFQKRLKVTPLTSFVGSMSQRDGVRRFYMQFFQQHQLWVQKSGRIRQLIYSVRLPHGTTMYLLRKICRGLVRTYKDCVEGFFVSKTDCW